MGSTCMYSRDIPLLMKPTAVRAPFVRKLTVKLHCFGSERASMARTATSVPRSHWRPHTWMRCAEPSFMTEICLVWLLAKSMMARENDIDARSTFMPQPAKRSRSRVSRTREDQSAFIYKRHSLQPPPRARVSARWAAAASESQVSSVNALTLFCEAISVRPRALSAAPRKMNIWGGLHESLPRGSMSSPKIVRTSFGFAWLCMVKCSDKCYVPIFPCLDVPPCTRPHARAFSPICS